MSERDPLVADLVDEAGRRGAYGALITEAHRQWAKMLQERWGIESAPRDVALADTIERIATALENIAELLLRQGG